VLHVHNSPDWDDVYLEPLLSTAVTALKLACTLVQPYHDWTLLVCPLGPYSFDLSTSSNFSNKIGGCTAIAHNLLIGDGHGRVVVGPLALDCLR
jgi:hypothetical protein